MAQADTLASHRGYEPELGHVGSGGIDPEVCWRMKSWRLQWSIRQLCCSGVLVSTKRMLALLNRLTDRLGVSGVVLLPLDVWLHVGWRHQAYRMPERPELARPMMRRAQASIP